MSKLKINEVTIHELRGYMYGMIAVLIMYVFFEVTCVNIFFTGIGGLLGIILGDIMFNLINEEE